MKFGQKKVEKKKEFYGAKSPIKIWNVNVNYTFISILTEMKNNFKCFTENLDDFIRPFVLISAKINGYVNFFTDKNNKLMSLSVDDDRLLEKYETFWTKIEDLKNIELKTLQVYDDRYIKTKMRTYDNQLLIIR